MPANPSSMLAGVCGAQAPLLGAQIHRSRHAENDRKRRVGEKEMAHTCGSQLGTLRSWGNAQFKLLLEFKGLGTFTIWNSIQCKLGGFKIAWTPFQYHSSRSLSVPKAAIEGYLSPVRTSSLLSSTLANQPVPLGLPAGPCRTLLPSLVLIPQVKPPHQMGTNYEIHHVPHLFLRSLCPVKV